MTQSINSDGQPEQYAPPPQYSPPLQYGQLQYAAPVYQQQPGIRWRPGSGGPFDGAFSPDDLARPMYGATFGQAIRRFFKNYANFKGRASRSEFWWARLFLALIALPLLPMYVGGLSMVMTSPSRWEFGPTMTAESQVGMVLFFSSIGLFLLGGLAVLLPILAIHWRRLHDSNFAGPLFLLILIPEFGGIIMLIFTLLPSNMLGRRFDRR